ncbi:hypothetical protein [Natranaeroarchaeum sulfidigenes]|uniref:Putative membrane protein n=1 Tax=Natranaeroarchaeum sulfidigenes TaxID=2784880 RepID=A0A897MPN0_9EURY|nr:hypothetical protein [Natranaeroarchaeum sulfidigenes]QSG02517.1 putative membrane protein [Natranaeroarchaeum sulfidigenes]
MARDIGSSAINTIVAVGAMLIIGMLVIGSVYATVPTDTASVTDEEVIMDIEEPVALDPGEDAFSFSETIDVELDDGTPLEEGTDYEWDSDEGEIQFLDSADVTDGDPAYVDYEYEAPDEMAQSIIGPLSSAFDLGSVLPIVIIAGSILFFLRGFGSGENRR